MVFWPSEGWLGSLFWTDNIETLLQEMTERGTQTKGGLVTKDYGCREFVVIAPDGQEIVFGEIVTSS